jgi:hypothetical protein
VSATENGVVASTVFDLAGRAGGLWDVVATKPDASTATLPAAFRIDPQGHPQVWADLVGRSGVRIRRPARYLLMFGNRGNVDAHAVPLGISFPSDYPYTLRFAIAPPPARAGQVPTNWSEVGIAANTGPASGITSIMLLIPVIPAGFTGALELTVTPPRAAVFEFTFGVGDPYYGPALNPRVVNAFIEGAQAYARRSFGVNVFRPRAELEAYITGQLEAVVSAGSADLVGSVGTVPRVHTVPHLMIDLARFAAVLPE